MARPLTEAEQKTVQELSDKYDGLVKPYLIKDRLVVVRAASPGELHRYKDTIAKVMASQNKRGLRQGGGSMADAERTLALACIAHPSIEEAKALIEGPGGRPGFLGTAATVAEELASEGVEEIEGN